jgi:hypothetical protein
MADSDYTLAVVLQASDEGMSSTLKGTSKNIEDVSTKAATAQINFVSMMVGLEGLTSGLNQATGGLRKFSAAMNQTGMATQEETEHLNKRIATIELFTGPMESLIAVVKIATVVTQIHTAVVGINTSAMVTATAVNFGFAASQALVLVGMAAFLGVLGLAIILLIDTERGLAIVESGLKKTADTLVFVVAGREAGGAVREFFTVGPLGEMGAGSLAQ